MTAEIIDFIATPGWIEESAGRRKFQITMDPGIREYEKKMLASGECRYTIPMHFITEDHALQAFYDFTGYIQLKEYAKRKIQSETVSRGDPRLVANVLQILSGVMECVKGMENYLFLPDRITVHPDVVFIDLNHDRAVLAFWPNDNTEMTLQSRIIGLIRDLRGLFRSDETDQYLEKIEDFISAKNPGLEGMISFIGSMQREVSYIYWNTKNFRGTCEQEIVPKQTKKRRERFDLRLKVIAVQLILVIGLIAIFLSGKLSMTNFVGLILIAGAIDLLILKKQKALDSHNI